MLEGVDIPSFKCAQLIMFVVISSDKLPNIIVQHLFWNNNVETVVLDILTIVLFS